MQYFYHSMQIQHCFGRCKKGEINFFWSWRKKLQYKSSFQRVSWFILAIAAINKKCSIRSDIQKSSKTWNFRIKCIIWANCFYKQYTSHWSYFRWGGRNKRDKMGGSEQGLDSKWIDSGDIINNWRENRGNSGAGGWFGSTSTGWVSGEIGWENSHWELP